MCVCEHITCINRYLHAELRESLTPPEHIFGDVKSFFVKEVLLELADLQKAGAKITFASLRGMIKSGSAVAHSAYCFVHGVVCKHPRCELHQASPACVDFSPCGRHAGSAGSTMPDFAAWCALRRLIKEDVIIVEAHCATKHFPPVLSSMVVCPLGVHVVRAGTGTG
jgi:hypothetical protein